MIVRKWWVGHQTQAGQEGDQHSVQKAWARVPRGHLFPHHPEKAPLLHHQHHRSLCALLLPLPPCLLLTCKRFFFPHLCLKTGSCWVRTLSHEPRHTVGEFCSLICNVWQWAFYPDLHADDKTEAWHYKVYNKSVVFTVNSTKPHHTD